MQQTTEIRAAFNDPQHLETLYQSARTAHTAEAFIAEINACHAEQPDNVLFAAWHYRFQHSALEEQAERRHINWKLAIPLGVLTGLLLWGISDPDLHFPAPSSTPYLALLVGPVVGLVMAAFLTFTARRGYARFGWLSLGLVALTAYVLALALHDSRYADLMILHLPVLTLAVVGLTVADWRSPPTVQFAFLFKCIEAVVTGGVYLIGIAVFVGVVEGMFQALSIDIPEVYARLMIAGSVGLIAIVAVATVYDPTLGPLQQDFRRGLSRMVVTLPRVLLPLTLIVLVIYLVAIPFNFMTPFKNRDVLIVYNGMLFAVMALLLGATPLRADEMSPRYQALLRGGILAVAGLVVLVSLYALSATVYRTVLGGLTLNRLTIIGWNSLNIALLVVLLYKQIRHGLARWIDSLHATFSLGALGYVAWALFVVLATPWIF